MIELLEIEIKKIFKRPQTRLILLLLCLLYAIVVITTKLFHTFNVNFVIENSFSTLQFFPLVLIIFTTSSVAIEYQTGAIKNLVCNVQKRYKIVISKFLALVITSFFMYMSILVLNFLTAKFIFLATKKVIRYSCLWTIGSSIESVYLISFSLVLAFVFYNQAISVSLSVITYFLANLIDGSIFSMIKHFEIIKYNPINLFNFKMELVDPSFIKQTHLTMSNFLYLFIIYICINIVFSIFILSKKDF